ncbi:ATP-dependent helicase [Clostridium peptidivorans]|uniref:ATP-dependent helicase n=1 Tax=Clostridium peptidivorans TaxID=100174 RepID=UPI000BE30F19|nr:ATP-dependent helicase [Clostridium peptidivorans]
MISENKFLELIKSLNINLTASQMNAVITINGPLAFIAVPGAGKTLTAITRIANMVLCHDVFPENILAITFSKASAQDMSKKFHDKFGDLITDKVHFSTIHSFAYSVVMYYSKLVNKNFILIEGNSNINKGMILTDLYRKYNHEYLSEDKLEELSGYISYIKNSMIRYNDLLKEAEDVFPIPHFLDVYKNYHDIMVANNYLDFDDMLTYCLVILEKNTELLNRYRSKYKYILVDEAQDTSKVQYEIIKLLSAPLNNLCLLGDDDQVLYSWRAAFPEVLLNFKKNYPSGNIVFAEQNFRSTKCIVSAANEFIKQNKNRYRKNMITENAEGSNIKLITLNSIDEQSQYIINYLKKEKDYKNTAVLFRNNISALPLVDLFSENNIPFYIKDVVPRFFNHWITKDLLRFLEFAERPFDYGLFKDIYYKMGTYLTKQDIQKLYYDIDNKTNIFKILNMKYPDKGFIDFHIKFDILKNKKPFDALSYIENELGYKDYLNKYAKEFKYSMDNINTILATLKTISSNTGSISEFKEKLNNLELTMSKAKYVTEGVTLATFHSSKGCEWDTVFVIDMIKNIFPTITSIKKAVEDDDFTELEEERRLCYVAVTRGKKQVYLIHPKGSSSVFFDFFQKYNNKKLDESRKKAQEIEKIKQDKEFELELNSLHIGKKITHKQFGAGKIIALKPPNMEIKFSDNLIKNLSIEICLKNRLIKQET